MTTPAHLASKPPIENRTKPKYIYDRSGYWYYVYKMEYSGTSSMGTKVSEGMTKEQVKIETYRLNGWELKK